MTQKIQRYKIAVFYIIEKTQQGFTKKVHSGHVDMVFAGGFQMSNAQYPNGKMIPIENLIRVYP